MTDSLRLIPQRSYIEGRFVDSLDLTPQDNRTGDEIALDIITRAGLRVKGGEE